MSYKLLYFIEKMNPSKPKLMSFDNNQSLGNQVKTKVNKDREAIKSEYHVKVLKKIEEQDSEQGSKEDHLSDKAKQEREVARVFVETGLGLPLFHSHSSLRLDFTTYHTRFVTVFNKTLNKLLEAVSEITGKNQNYADRRMSPKRAVLLRCREWMSAHQLETFFKMVCITFDLLELSKHYFINEFPINQSLFDLFKSINQQIVKYNEGNKRSHIENIRSTIGKPVDRIDRYLIRVPLGGRKALSINKYSKQIVELFASYGSYRLVVDKLIKSHPKLKWNIEDVGKIIHFALIKALVKALKIDLQKKEKNPNYQCLRLNEKEINRVVKNSNITTKVLLARIYMARSYCSGMTDEVIKQIRTYQLNKKMFKSQAYSRDC